MNNDQNNVAEMATRAREWAMQRGSVENFPATARAHIRGLADLLLSKLRAAVADAPMLHDDYKHDGTMLQRAAPKGNPVAEIKHRDGHPYAQMRSAYDANGDTLQPGTLLYAGSAPVAGKAQDMEAALGAALCRANSAEAMWHKYRANSDRYVFLRDYAGHSWAGWIDTNDPGPAARPDAEIDKAIAEIRNKGEWACVDAAPQASEAADAARYRLAVKHCILVLRGDAALGREEWDRKLDRMANGGAA